MLPFHFGTPEQFAAVRTLLRDAGYTTATVCQRGGVDDIHQFRAVGEGRSSGLEVADAADVLIRLFLDGLAVPAEQVEGLLGEAGLGALRDLGLLDPHPDDAARLAATVLLYPTGSLYLVSDLETYAPGRARPDELERPDHVFSAITTLTGTFMSQLPDAPCDRMLELCAGTGVAALAAAPAAGHAWALDITERATRFAEFNARLNGIDNFTALCGDLYDPVAGMTFDRIVAHPPYVPATRTHMIYRDGGEDGEQVIRRILAGLPEHLASGGRFYCTCIGTDRSGAPLERRIRDMVGGAEAEFDLLLVTHQAMHPAEYYSRLATSGRISFETAEQRLDLFRRLEAEQVVYCSFVLQRHASPRAPFTVRRERGAAAAGAETEWLLQWSTALAERDVLPALLEARPRLSPHARLDVRHRVDAGQWAVDACRLRLDFPFVRTVELSLNAAMLLTLCDGTRTVREILARVRQAGALGEEVPETAFAEWVRELTTEGALLLADGSAPADAVPSPAPLAH